MIIFVLDPFRFLYYFLHERVVIDLHKKEIVDNIRIQNEISSKYRDDVILQVYHNHEHLPVMCGFSIMINNNTIFR